jgi:peptide/nickel transport system permease protein
MVPQEIGLEAESVAPPGVRPRSRLFRNRMLVFGLALVALWILLAVLAPLISPYGPNTPDMAVRLTGPSWRHLMGTDEYGRDILTRVLFGARISVFVAVMSSIVSVAIGLPLGLYAGYRGGFAAEVVMRLMDILLAFPSLVLALAIGAAVGPGVAGEIAAIGLVNIPVYARQAQSQTAAVRQLTYVESALAQGSSFPRLAWRHILPNMFTPVLVSATLGLGFAVLTAAGLSYLGLGIQPPTADWGSMISDGSQYVVTGQWWMSVFPGLAIMSLVFAFNTAGDGLRDLLDPRSQRRLGGASIG